MMLLLISSLGPDGKVLELGNLFQPNAYNFMRGAGDRAHWLRVFNLEMQGPEFELPPPI